MDIQYEPVSTPLMVGQCLSSMSNPTAYRSLVGTLQYLVITRADLSHSVNMVCQFIHAPTKDHYCAAKRILRYVKGTLTYGLNIYANSSLSLIGYFDVDWEGCPNTRSTPDFVVFFGLNLISSSTKKQPFLAQV
ncbi:uncharacterized protein LOC111409469 [Olea europaea var. sylvestris]|uniref:uncharacterized protein LOC111409469 n=1 Tax=Olea europaea var. sylvestris TaxID=158386 RepID=UPI000C1D6183|nr:uncharacterized protein LOC111409469 [Olea europaea var. sylvestris]